MENKEYLIEATVEYDYTVTITKNLTQDEYNSLKNAIEVIQNLASGLIDDFVVTPRVPPEVVEPIIQLDFEKMIRRYLPTWEEAQNWPLFKVSVICPKCKRVHGDIKSIYFDTTKPTECLGCGAIYKYPKETFYVRFKDYCELFRKGENK